MAVKRFSNSLISQSGQDKVTNFIAGYSPAVDEMDLIERVVVGSGGASSITFSNIPQTYQHLELRIVGRGDLAANRVVVLVRPNNDSGSNYSSHYLLGTGASTLASGAVSQTSPIYCSVIPCSQYNSNNFGITLLKIFDYSSTAKNKTILSVIGADNNATGATDVDKGFIQVASGLWMNTSAISSLVLVPGANFIENTTASLYGVVA